MHRGLMAAVVLVALATVGLTACGDDAAIPGRADVADSLPETVATIRSTSSGLAPVDRSFDTGVQEPGDSTLVVFGEPGTVEFEDALDPDRTGEVRVAPVSPGS